MRIFHLLYLMARLPMAAFAYSLETLVRIARDVQLLADESLSVIDGEAGYELEPWPSSDAEALWELPLDSFYRADETDAVRDDTTPQPCKEERKMYVDQDLSGDMVKVVQYSIVSVVTFVQDNARVICGPEIIAFADDMTSADFSTWIMAKHCDLIDECKLKWQEVAKSDPECPPLYERCFDRKFLRVAFSVMGRFAPADIGWDELQAISVAKIAHRLNRPWPYPPLPSPKESDAADSKPAKKS